MATSQEADKRRENHNYREFLMKLYAEHGLLSRHEDIIRVSVLGLLLTLVGGASAAALLIYQYAPEHQQVISKIAIFDLVIGIFGAIYSVNNERKSHFLRAVGIEYYRAAWRVSFGGDDIRNAWNDPAKIYKRQEEVFSAYLYLGWMLKHKFMLFILLLEILCIFVPFGIIWSLSAYPEKVHANRLEAGTVSCSFCSIQNGYAVSPTRK